MRPARASRIAALAAAALAPLGVSLASCASLDGLTGGARDGGANVDGFVPADSQGGTDAPGPVDAPLAPDAGGDAPQATDGGVDAPPIDAGSWCSRQSPTAAFCDDFDTAPLMSGWSYETQTGGGVLALDSTSFFSAPHAARATTGPTSSSAKASLSYDAPTTGTTVHVELMVRYAQIDPGAYIKTAGFSVTNAAGDDLYAAFFIGAAGSAYLEETTVGEAGALFRDTPLSMAPAVGQWEHVQIDVVLPSAGGPAPTATVTLGPNVVLDHRALYGGGANGGITLNAGLEVYPQAAIGPCQLDVDDVLLLVAP